MPNDIHIQPASLKDEAAIKSLLAESGLPHEDIRNHLVNFLIAKRHGKIVGAVGVERYGEVGLLRSLVVASQDRNLGIGTRLLNSIVSSARSQGIAWLYLLTTSAGAYFERSGFKIVDRSSAPPSIQQTGEFRHLCPQSAFCMLKNIQNLA